MAESNSNGSKSTVAWGAAAAVVVALISLFWSVANPRDDIKQVEARFDAQQTQLENRIQATIREIQQQINARLTTAVHEEFARRVDKHIDAIDSEIKDLQNSRIIRQEYQKDLGVVDQRMIAQRETVRNLQQQFAGSYNVGKQLDNLQDQIRLLQQRLDTSRQVTASPPAAIVPVIPGH